jgi:glycine cleavage system regulatory protein
MQIPLVMTIIGKDRPGIVESVAEKVVKHGGNWLESRMCRLGGEFAGILRIEIPSENEEAFLKSIGEFSKSGLIITTKRDEQQITKLPSVVATLSVVGHDRPGIVYQISSVLARYNVNVEELETECKSAPMSGEPLFTANAHLKIPESCDISELRRELEKIGNDLMVDTSLQMQ